MTGRSWVRQCPVRRTAGALATLVVVVTACVGGSALAQSSHPTPAGHHGAVHRAPRAWADSVLATLTLRQKAAQLVWPNLLGDYAASDAVSWRKITHAVVDEQVGGLLMSVGSPIEIAAKLNALQAAAPLPLLVSADLEYGAGMRARGGYFLPNAIDLGGATVFPPQMAIGAVLDTTLAYEEGRITAIEGRALGIHIDFAPDLDVNNNAANPVINTRSYGEAPAQVAALGRSFIRGLQEHGMVATGKHFPGHGDTDVNSHLALPIVGASRARLDSVELVPFRAAIETDVGLIMTFHGSMPALDSSGTPGTLSSAVLTQLLRHEMGFRGIIVSDAMDMRAIVDQYGGAESVKRAIAAGADVLIQPVDVTQAIDAVVAGVGEGRYSEARLDSSVKRILDLKHSLGIDRHRFVSIDSLRTVVGDSANQAIAHRAADLSITLVKDSLQQLPISYLPPTTHVLSVTVAHRPDLAAGVASQPSFAHGSRGCAWNSSTPMSRPTRRTGHPARGGLRQCDDCRLVRGSKRPCHDGERTRHDRVVHQAVGCTGREARSWWRSETHISSSRYRTPPHMSSLGAAFRFAAGGGARDRGGELLHRPSSNFNTAIREAP